MKPSMSMLPSEMPSPEPLLCDPMTITTLQLAASSLTSFDIDCTMPSVYTADGRFILRQDTICTAPVIFSGSNQIVDCQGNMLGSSSGINILTFKGNGPYLVTNCNFSGLASLSTAIRLDGANADVLRTIDILIEESSFQGTVNNLVGVALVPQLPTTLCAMIEQLSFLSFRVGITVIESTGGRVFLEVSDVATSSSGRLGTGGFGTTISSDGGGLVVAKISGLVSSNDNIGLSAGSGNNLQLSLQNSKICGSTILDIDLQSPGTMNSFDNLICTMVSNDLPICDTLCG
jgi:hypothetical protein